ncbi:hypothetical protein [Terasakiella pusilla]|uniref:hypothetical protein n=1 Tax=Terasakiella pusilla TaxID=64973 RepID=UPI003AA8DF6C
MSEYIKSNAAQYIGCASFLYKTACFVMENPKNPAFKKDFKEAIQAAKAQLGKALNNKPLQILIREMMSATVLHLPEDNQDFKARQRAMVVYKATLKCGK